MGVNLLIEKQSRLYQVCHTALNHCRPVYKLTHTHIIVDCPYIWLEGNIIILAHQKLIILIIGLQSSEECNIMSS